MEIEGLLNEGEEILCTVPVSMDLIEKEKASMRATIKRVTLGGLPFLGGLIFHVILNLIYILIFDPLGGRTWLNALERTLLYMIVLFLPASLMSYDLVWMIFSMISMALMAVLYIILALAFCIFLPGLIASYNRLRRYSKNKYWLTNRKFIKRRGTKFKIIDLSNITAVRDVRKPNDFPDKHIFYVIGKKKRSKIWIKRRRYITVEYAEDQLKFRELIKDTIRKNT